MNKLQRFFAGLLGVKAAPPNTPGRFMVINGSITWMADDPATYIRDGYQGNDIVYSAIRRVEDKIRVAPWALYKVKSDNSLKVYKSHLLAGNYEAAAKMQKKALEPLESFNTRTGKWNELLKWVNEYETFADFVANGAAYKMLTGNKFWWANILEAGANQGIPQEMYALPSQYMSIIAKPGFPVKTLGYQLSYGENLQLTKETVLHEKYFNPSYDYNGAHLYGQSPLQAASKNLTRNNYAKTATTKKFENGGFEGVLYVNDDRVTPEQGEEQVKAVKKILSSEYSGADNAGKIAVSGYPMGFVSVAQTTKDLMTLEFEDLDLRRLANIWGIPSQLLNDPENSAEANVVEAERQLASNCVLPQLTATRDNMNRKLTSDWGLKGENVVLDFDLSVYRELQEDQDKKWGWVKELTVPEAYKLELMGMEVPDSLPNDLIIVDGSKMTLEDLINGQMNDQQAQAIADGLNKAGLNDYGV